MAEKGLFIAIEGGDGSGKATQTEILHQHLNGGLGKQVMKLSFPRYGQASAYYVERYLNGAYGTADEVPADLGSLPYAVDRFAASHDIEAFLADPEAVVLTDRYVASNLAHQGTKVHDRDERIEFYERSMALEYGLLKIPRPDKNIVLLVPPHIAQQNVDLKDVRTYTEKKRDIHEANADHLDRAKRNYEELCELYPGEYIAIECMDETGQMRSIEDIQADIRATLLL